MEFSPQNLHANSEYEQERDLGDLILGLETHLHLVYGGQAKNLKLKVSSNSFFHLTRIIDRLHPYYFPLTL